MKPLLTLHQTAERLGSNYARTAELIRVGILPAVHLGRQVRVDPEALEQFIRDGGKALPGGWRRGA